MICTSKFKTIYFNSFLLICTSVVLKVLANEDTLLLMMFVGLRKLGNICCGHKMFLNKNRNVVCVPDTKFVAATNVARAGNGETFVSATMCPRLPGPLGLGHSLCCLPFVCT